MIQLIIRRLLLMIPLLILTTMVIFTISKLQPGDAFSGEIDPKNTNPEYIKAQRLKLGLDDPIPIQYVKWAKKTLSGDLGDSIRYKRPVIDLVKERMPNTVLLGTVSLIITYFLAFLEVLYFFFYFQSFES